MPSAGAPRRTAVLLLLLLLLGSACATGRPLESTPTLPRPVVDTTATPAPAASPTLVQPTPTAAKKLTLCLPEEPTSLYRYGVASPAAETAWAALYTQDYETLGYAPQAIGLERIPSLAAGDAAVRLVQVSAGDRVVDAAGEVLALAAGVRVRTADGLVTAFAGAPLIMEQIVVDFVMKPRIWADGEPVTADDSVYGFGLAQDPATPGEKGNVARTASYQATGNLRTRWIGLPGFLAQDFATMFWPPAPQHAWGDLSAEELLSAPRANREPLGDGPFRLVSWTPGEMMRLERNPHYYRRDEGLPRLDELTLRFVPDLNNRLALLLGGQCDIVVRDGLDRELIPFFDEAAAQGLAQPVYRDGPQRVELLMGVNSAAGYGDGAGRPDWFEDQRFRQALALCVDRQRLVERFAHGRSRVSDSYVPPGHPLHAVDIPRWPFDPTAANRLLDELGHGDGDNDGTREDSRSGAPLAFSLLAGAAPDERELGQQIASDLGACGLDVTVVAAADAVDSALAGRVFDLALFSSPATAVPDCERFAGWRIPGQEAADTAVAPPAFAATALNVTGWSDPAYDAACAAALGALPGTPRNISAHQEAQRLFAAALPALPLFLDPQTTVTRPGVRHVTNDPSARTDLWNLFAIDHAPADQNGASP